jgi:hypothetical protein
MLTKKITKEEVTNRDGCTSDQGSRRLRLGVGMPILAGALAKHTHAPQRWLLMESGIVDFEPVILPMNIADATCTRGYGYAIDLFSVFTTITYAGYVNKAFLAWGRIDRYGNINTSYLECRRKPSVSRLREERGILCLCQGNDLDHEGERFCRENCPIAHQQVLGVVTNVNDPAVTRLVPVRVY